MKLIDAERMKELFDYNPNTGVLVRRKSSGGRKAGSATGTPNAHGHLVCSVDDSLFYVHRIAWAIHYGRYPQKGIDHINGNKQDNRIANLRLATQSENLMNACLHSNNTSGCRGVYFNKTERRWVAEISAYGRRYILGRFKDKDKAAVAYAEAANLYHGEFARTV